MMFFSQAKEIVENDTFQDFKDLKDKGLISHFNLNELLEDSPRKEGDFAGEAKKRRVNKNVSTDQPNIQDRPVPFPGVYSDEKKKKNGNDDDNGPADDPDLGGETSIGSSSSSSSSSNSSSSASTSSSPSDDDGSDDGDPFMSPSHPSPVLAVNILLNPHGGYSTETYNQIKPIPVDELIQEYSFNNDDANFSFECRGAVPQNDENISLSTDTLVSALKSHLPVNSF